MLHPETLEAYRRMTPSERLAIALEMIRANAQRLFSGSPEIVERRVAILNQQNHDRNQQMLTAISRSRRSHG
ncbi:MAG: hypothetical protein DWH91_01685 [Planctomycetota bacterium]|nr:MAG: hypothetical protein DWH91_01685 [Planctomycetota bacterium]